jgi:putative FmdB family regulatory protein
MPLYEYVCQACRKRMEVIQSFSDKLLKICPHCGKKALKKAISAPAIQFKGSGWYVTDYGNRREGAGRNKKPAADEAKSESKEKAAETKTETKAGAKTETKKEKKD